MLPTSAARALALGAFLGIAAFAGGARRPAAADVIAPGFVGIETTFEIDWGPLAPRLARPVAAAGDDTWETLAAREAGDARWAATVRALNGGGERPAPTGATWVPPRAVPFGPDAVWYSAYLDSSKFGAESDVSRTGFQRLDPGATSSRVFGTVTVALVRHTKPEDAARAAALPRTRPREALAAHGDEALVVAAPILVAITGPESSPVRRTVQRWRCTGIEGTSLRLSLVGTTSYDAGGRPLSPAEAAPGGLRPEWVAGVAAIVALSVVMLAVARRRRRHAPDA